MRSKLLLLVAVVCVVFFASPFSLSAHEASSSAEYADSHANSALLAQPVNDGPLIESGAPGGRSAPAQAPKGKPGVKYNTGTGIMVTCYHTVKEAKNISIWHEASQKSYKAHVLKFDKDNDIAILKVDNLSSKPVPLAAAFAERRGEEVLTLGYPIVDVQGFEQKASFGRVNAHKGYKDDARFAQVDVPIHPGNSGGPLFNNKGEVVGIIAASLGRKTLEATGTIPQNVSYVVKVDYLWPLLGKEVPRASLAGPAGGRMEMPDVVAAREDSVMQILVEK